MTYVFQNPSQDTIFDFLKEAKTIAVVGLSNREPPRRGLSLRLSSCW